MQHGKTFAADLAGFPFAGTFLFRLASGPAYFLDHGGQAFFGAAAALRQDFPAHRLVARSEQVHHAEFVGVNSKMLREDVHLAFNRPVGFKVTKAAVGGAEHLVGVNGF